MADTRTCEQCGIWFVPRREHARFCSADCRAAWNREHAGDLTAGASALVWAITAMSDTTEQLPRMRAADWPRAFAVIGEAVWWVTIVDATLVRHHPPAYDRATGRPATGTAPADRGNPGRAALRAEPDRPRSRSWWVHRARHGRASRRRRAYHGLGMEAGAGTGNRAAATTRAGVGDDAVPGLPGAPGGSHHRGEFRAGR